MLEIMYLYKSDFYVHEIGIYRYRKNLKETLIKF
jgi:hypothetical protein